jgi:hypothetical protein
MAGHEFLRGRLSAGCGLTGARENSGFPSADYGTAAFCAFIFAPIRVIRGQKNVRELDSITVAD